MGGKSLHTNQKAMVRDSKRMEQEMSLGQSMLICTYDASPMVRYELIIALAELIYHQQEIFIAIASSAQFHSHSSHNTPSSPHYEAIMQRMPQVAAHQREIMYKTAWMLWRAVLKLCKDPKPEVANAALALRK